MKKILIGLLGVLAVTSAYGAKKVDDLINISTQLLFKLSGLPKVNLGRKTVTINIKVTNPSNYDLEAKYLKIKNIQLALPGESPFAKSSTEIKNITIPANSEITINNIVFKVHINILQSIKIIKDFKTVVISADVSALGQSINLNSQSKGLGCPECAGTCKTKKYL